jgi:hypothetical protein
MIHELDILGKYYTQIINNNKHFELRRDRGFCVGDSILLKELCADGIGYTKRELTKTIKYISRDVPQYGLMD